MRYVQGLLRERGEEVRRLVEGEGACVLFAGSAVSGIVGGVRQALVDALGGEGGGGKEALKALECRGGLVVEAW